MHIDLFKGKLIQEFGDFVNAKYPKRRIFRKMRKQLDGMTSENVMMLLGVAARCLNKKHTYLEVGCFRGCTACAAMSQVRGKRFVFVDNFSEFNDNGKNRETLLKNLKHHCHGNHYRFFEQDFAKVIEDEDFKRAVGTIGVYLYDGAHDYTSQIQGLLMPYHFLAKGALVIVDDINMDAARKADDELIKGGMFNLIYRFRTPRNGYTKGWWNGVDVLVKT